MEEKVVNHASQLRPEVLMFAFLMEARLRDRDEKFGTEGWKECAPEYLRIRICDQFTKLNAEVLSSAWSAVEVQAADVANFAMMLREHAVALAMGLALRERSQP